MAKSSKKIVSDNEVNLNEINLLIPLIIEAIAKSKSTNNFNTRKISNRYFKYIGCNFGLDSHKVLNYIYMNII
jgi:hypothetical protein